MQFCSFASGSSANCAYIESDNKSLLIDAGITGKKLEKNIEDLSIPLPSAILITHEHIDHIKGLGVIHRKYNIPIYTTEKTKGILLGEKKRVIGKIDEDMIITIEKDRPFKVDKFEVEAFTIPHDAIDPVGYRITDGKKHFVSITDLGCFNDYIISHLKSVDGILLESNHDLNMLEMGGYTYQLKRRIAGRNGHLSNEDSARLLCEIITDRLKNVFLGHLSMENNYPDIAYMTAMGFLKKYRQDIDYNKVNLHIASGDVLSRLVEV